LKHEIFIKYISCNSLFATEEWIETMKQFWSTYLRISRIYLFTYYKIFYFNT